MVNGKFKPEDILKGVGAGLCLLDRDFHIIWINKYQADWFGTPQDICGKYCYKIFEHRPRICPSCPTRRVFKKGTVQIGKRRIGFTRNGQKHYYQLTVSPIRDHSGKVVCALELVQDVTDAVMKERENLKIINKLKNMDKHLSLVNRRLQSNVERLREITQRLLGTKRILKEVHRKEKNELMVLKEELQDILKINRTLSSTVDLKKASSLITRLTCELIHTDACVLRLLDEDKKILMVNSLHGVSQDFIKKAPFLKAGESVVGMVIKTRKPMTIYNINTDSRLKCRDLLKKENMRSVLCVPVIFQDKVLGAISTYSKKPRRFLEKEIEILSIFASQVAIAIQEAKHYEDIHKNYFNTMHALVIAIETRDPYMHGHTERVTKYALEIGRALELSQTEIEILRYAAEVHDVGKISVSDLILRKPGRLTPTERAEIELHPIKGVEVLEPLDFLRPALPVVRHHHERYDGRGYPDGLVKEKIPLLSRVIACADAFDAMTAERPYRRRRLTIEEALAEIKNNAGSQFDPNISHLFIKLIQDQLPAGAKNMRDKMKLVQLKEVGKY